MRTTPDAPATDRLLSYLTEARWFAGKGRRAELADLTPLPWLTRSGEWPAVRSEVAEVRYREEGADAESGDPHELYQLLVAYYPAPRPDLEHAEVGRFTLADLGAVVAYDAARDPAACRVLLHRLLAGAEHTDGDRRVAFHLGHAGPLSPDLPASVFAGQQSNTSVIFGGVGMLKLFRRLEPGRNLDIEVHDALARSGVPDVADLYGWVEASWLQAGNPVAADLAMAVEMLAGAEDGWALALETLRQGRSFADDAAALGVALAETHAALAAAFGTTTRPGRAVATAMEQRLTAAAVAAPALRRYVAGLTDCFEALTGSELTVQRVHGDFHLGQTLRTPGGWKIIDFEGEPAKSLAERAEPDGIWRDLAGMLRSFDYAAASVPGPDAADWAAECRSAFLAGYTGGEPGPDDAGRARGSSDAAALRAYEADKAIYEVVYEVRNRPDWVRIPLAAVAALTDGQQPAPAGAREESGHGG